MAKVAFSTQESDEERLPMPSLSERFAEKNRLNSMTTLPVELNLDLGMRPPGHRVAHKFHLASQPHIGIE